MKSFHLHARSIEERILSACRVALLIDFDGTISAFAPTPKQAIISGSAHSALRNMRGRFPIVVVSGRPLSVLLAKVGLSGLSYAGNHGAEWILEGRRGHAAISKRVRPAIAALRRQVSTLRSVYPGLLIEDKRLSVEFHFRSLRPSRRELCKKDIFEMAGKFIKTDGLSATDEGLSLEFFASLAWNKGDFSRFAMHTLEKRYGASLLPVYIGDAKTDESAFRALKSGITIRVGSSASSAAQYSFSKRSDVDRFLTRMERLTRDR